MIPVFDRFLYRQGSYLDPECDLNWVSGDVKSFQISMWLDFTQISIGFGQDLVHENLDIGSEGFELRV